MTEVPEHLLRRSKERRAALGLDGGGDGGDAAPPAPPAAGGEPAEPVEPAGDVPAVAATAAAPPAPVEAAPPPPMPAYLAAATTRPKCRAGPCPCSLVLPIWALIYAGTMTAGEAGITDPVLAEGEELYSANCAACHGPGGEGGTGRPLNGDNVLLTFPDPQQHIAWVTDGSPAPGTPYGDPNRPGGQHVSQSDGFGAMPAFGGTLTPEEIVAVVRYEREIIGGETESALAAGGEAEAGATTTTVAGEEGSTASTTPGATGGNTGGSGGAGTPDTTTPEATSPGSSVPAGTATTVAGNDSPDSSTPAAPGTTVSGSG